MIKEPRGAEATVEGETADIPQTNPAAAASAGTQAPPPPPGIPSEQAVLAALRYGPLRMNGSPSTSGLSDDVLHRALLTLELAPTASQPSRRAFFTQLDAAPPRDVLHSLA